MGQLEEQCVGQCEDQFVGHQEEQLVGQREKHFVSQRESHAVVHVDQREELIGHEAQCEQRPAGINSAANGFSLIISKD